MPSPCTVTCKFEDATGANLQGNAFVRFRLRNFSGFVPRVIGTTIIVETQIDVAPDSSGNISTPIWGNDNIDPGGTSNPPSTYYTVEYWNQGRITSQANYSIVGASLNLDTASQLNPPPVPPGVSGISTLLLQTNGTNNGSQSKLNQVGGSGITITDDGAGNISFSSSASIGTAPHMIGPGILDLHAAPQGSLGGQTNGQNNVVVWEFFLAVPTVSFGHISLNGQNSVAGNGNLYIGIYDSNKNRVWQTVLTIPNGTASRNFTIPALQLNPGTYYLAVGTDDPSGAIAYWAFAGPEANYFDSGTSNANIIQQITPRVASAANHIAGGSMPATLGALTTLTQTSAAAAAVPAFFFEP